MRIDLNDPAEFTVENVRRLLASKDDSRHRQLRITASGKAFLSDEVGNVNLDGLKCRFETWCQGNGYSGPKAAADDGWVNEVYDDLKNAWEKGLTGYIDYPPRSA